MKIAIVDSGIDFRLSDEVEKIYNYTEEEVFDNNGHGTCVFNYISNHCDDIEIIVFKIFDKKGKSTRTIFAKFLNAIKSIDIDILCMPFSFIINDKKNKYIDFDNDFQILNDRNIIMIAAHENGSLKSYPASNGSIIGVQGGFFANDKEFWFNNMEMVANIYPECVRTLNNKRCFFSGNSKACALATCIIASLYNAANGDIECLYKKIFFEAKTNTWKYKDINRDINDIFLVHAHQIISDDIINVHESVYADDLKYILKEFVGMEFYEKSSSLFDNNSFNLIKNIDFIIERVMERFYIEVRDEEIYPEDFVNFQTFLNATKRWISNYEKNK